MHQLSSVVASGLGAGVRPSDIHQTIEYIVKENNGGEGCLLDGRHLYYKRREPEDEQLGVRHNIVEENNGGEGCSLDGRHLYCKRRTPEDEQFGARLVLTLEADSIMHQPSSVTASGLGTGVGPSNNHQTIEYIVEENDDGEGCPLNGRHLYCERRAHKDEQLGAGLVLALEAASVMHQPSSVEASVLGAGARPSDIHQTIASGLGVGVGSSDIQQTIGVTREAQHSQRNIHLRRAPEDEHLGAGLVLSLELAPVMHQSLSVAASGLGASAGPSDTHQTIRVVRIDIQAERQSGTHPEVPVSFLITAQMISGLLYEVLPMINYIVSHGLPKDSDLDEEIENEMTEELDELEELMIEYRSGLAGAVIETHMKRQKYEANVVGSPLEDEKCCICQS
ncbi:hypothetical protein GH714_028776 [Hevea brasiliensis]|uniref:Uncharacterized protein n=1 Tax=Hevea brasiliensis TaxID=3981 RepID=A0A6A6N7Y0_HEVBR|nr:hypothetical protein GH714_028776 [Hevea brasiliensis]